mgnify:CR=1 FL=1
MLNTHFRELISHDIAIDLGTANTLMAIKGRGVVVNEPSLVVVGPEDVYVASGSEAAAMEGRAPNGLSVKRPLIDGVVANYEATQAMLKKYIDIVHASHRVIIDRPRIIIGLPSAITDVERRAVEQAAKATGARAVYTIEEPIAAAVGVGIAVMRSKGSLIVDIGGGTTEIAVISYGGIAATRSLRVAGDELSTIIAVSLRETHGILIGRATADRLKHTVASVHRSVQLPSVRARGKDTITGLPKSVTVTSAQLMPALIQELRPMIDAVRTTLESTPADLMQSIAEQGLILTGGGALLAGLDRLLSDELKIPCVVAQNPLSSVVEGAALILQRQATYRGLIGHRI